MRNDEFKERDLVVSLTYSAVNTEPVIWIYEILGDAALCMFWSSVKGKYIKQSFEITDIKPLLQHD